MNDETYLLTLPEPPGIPCSYNVGDGEVLHQFEGGRSLCHSWSVTASDVDGFACYVEVSGGSDTSELRVGAVQATDPPPTGKFEGSLAIGGSTIFRASICPRSRTMVISEPVADVKLLSAPLCGCGPWSLGMYRKDGYVRVFDCERATFSHEEFPTLFK